MKNLTKILLAAAALLCSFKVLAAGEVTGRVAGYVYDPTGAALSEVPLTISGTALLQPQARTTGDDGRFEFENLPPGEDYVIEVNVPGFTPIKQQGIHVRLGQTATTDIHLTVLTETQAAATYEIVEKANPIMNPDSAQAVAVITAEKAAETPIFHQVEGMAQQVAGVGPGTRPSTRGGLARHGKFYVDGLDTTDVTDGSISAPMNFDAVENFEIITGGFDAQYNSMGMITNAVTKNGSNEFKLDTSVTLNPTWMSAKTNFPSTQLGYYGDFINNPAPGAGTSFYSPIVNIGGPLIKDKLWFYASYQQNFSDRENAITVLGVNSNRPTLTTTSLGRVKFTFQATPRDRLTLGFNLDHNIINNSVGSSLVTDAAESRIDRGGNFIILNYTHNFSDAVLFEMESGMTYKQVNQDPAQCVVQSGFSIWPAAADPSDPCFKTVAHFDLNQRLTQFNADTIAAGFGNYLHETKYRLQFDPTISWKMKAMGTHQMKAGVQYAWLIDRQVGGETGNQSFTDRGGVCNPADSSTYTYCFIRIDWRGNSGGALITRATASDVGLFIQDRWTVNRQLTLIPGIRIDAGILFGDPTSARCDANGQNCSTNLTNLVGIGPRLSATYDLFGDRRTLLTANYGRNNDVGNIFVAQHGNQALTQYDSTFQGAASGFPDCVSDATQKGCAVVGGPGGRTIPYHSLTSPQKPPHVDEVMFGIHHEVVPETVIGVDLDYRRYSNMWADQETNIVWDPSGTKILGYADGKAHTIFSSNTFDQAWRDYKSIDFWVQGTPGRWDLLANYTLAFNRGTISDYYDGFLNNPRMTQFYEGSTPDDRRHTIKGSIAYRTLFGLDIGLRLEYRSGSPMWENFSNPSGFSTLYKSPRGTGVPVSTLSGGPNFNDPNQWTELRNPEQFLVHLQARYNLGDALHIKQRLELVMLVVNALNNDGAQTLFDTVAKTNSRFGEAQFHFSPFQAEALIRFRN